MTSAFGAGATYDLLLHPTADGLGGGSFWKEKAIGAISNGAAFATMEGVGSGSRQWLFDAKKEAESSFGRNLVRNITSGAMGGFAGGAVSTEADSILRGRGLTTDGLTENVLSYGVLGGAGGAFVRSKVEPASIPRPVAAWQQRAMMKQGDGLIESPEPAAAPRELSESASGKNIQPLNGAEATELLNQFLRSSERTDAAAVDALLERLSQPDSRPTAELTTALNNLAAKVLPDDADLALRIVERQIIAEEALGWANNPSHARALFSMEAVLANLGRLEEAQRYGKRSLELSLGHGGWQEDMSLQIYHQLLTKMGRTEEAARVADIRARASEPLPSLLDQPAQESLNGTRASDESVRQANKLIFDGELAEPLVPKLRLTARNGLEMSPDGPVPTEALRQELGAFADIGARMTTTMELDLQNDPVARMIADEAIRRYGSFPGEREMAVSGIARFLHRLEQSNQNTFGFNLEGETLPIGEAYRQGANVCIQDSLMLKAIADQLGIPLTLRLGRYNGELHAWTTFESNGQSIIYDPAMQVYGVPMSEAPAYEQGINQGKLVR
jgi:tetratricopeptide (TPR) repeat protein